MKEDLISFLWKFQYFNKEGLTTTASEQLSTAVGKIHVPIA